MASPSLLELAKLNRVSVDGSRLLCDVSLGIETGERIALCGKSGSGKTLLLRSLAALDPVDDCLRWRGQRISARDVPKFRARVIYVQQTPALPTGTVLAALQEPFLWSAHSGRRFARAEVVRLLQRLDRAENFLNKQTTDLSGGEAGLLTIVRALQLHPTVLLLDEPTAAMDQGTTVLVETLLRDWVTDDHGAYVWVTHNQEQAFRVANRTIQLVDGKVVT